MDYMKKIRIGILFGGKSAEHEVSLASAKNVAQALDRNKYEPVAIGIDKSGKWYLQDPTALLAGKIDKVEHLPSRALTVLPGEVGTFAVAERKEAAPLDVIFPILHGTFGEDGTVQGLLKLADIPFVGAGVLGSAVGMDKDVMKRLLRDAGVPIGKFLVFQDARRSQISFDQVIAELGSPVFVKPANLGSSVGVSKAKNSAEFMEAVENAFGYDRKIIVEEFIPGREIECAVLGNENPIASVPGEVIPQGSHEFYSYEAKYLDEHGAVLKIPADLPEKTIKEVQDIAVRTFKALSCEGLGRVDSFLTPDGRVIANEINTIPGFTKISMYPKLWEASGIPYGELIDRLITLAIERHAKERQLKTSYLN